MKKHILVVINTLGKAGAEVALMEMLRHFPPQKYRTHIFVLMGQGEMIQKLPTHVRLLNKEYKPVSPLAPEGKWHMYGTILKAALVRATIIRRIPYLVKNLTAMIKNKKIWPDKLLWRILSDGAPRASKEYDLAISYLEGGAAYYVADHVNAKKKAAWIHIDYNRAGYTRELDRDCYLKFDRIFPVSDEVRDNFLQVYPECADRTKVFRNMINQDEIWLRSQEDGGFTDGFQGIRLLSVGRLTYQKAFHISIEAMKLLKEEGYTARWYVLGEGNLRAELEKQIAELGLEKDFLLLGSTDNPYPYMFQTDLYIHASRFEGKSIAIQEAQTLGCSIIASDVSGNKEQIESGEDGLLVDLDPQSIKRGIIELITDEAKRKRFGDAAANKKINHPEDLEMLFELMENAEETE